MYTNQLCHVKWGVDKSASFSISNGVKQGGVISPFLFSLYIDEPFSNTLMCTLHDFLNNKIRFVYTSTVTGSHSCSGKKIIRAPRVHLVINKGVWIGYHVVLTYAGAFGYAYNVALVALSLSSLKQMIKNCEQFAESHSITYNPTKTKLLFFNMKPESVFPPIYLNGESVSIVEHEKHLGNYVASDIADRNLIANVCDLYQRSNVYCLAILE